METLRRKICVDNVRSHKNGIVPFCPFNQQDKIVNVDAGIYNGNYRGFPCDFVFIDASGVTVNGVLSVQEKEYSRKIYLDTLTKYRFITTLLKGADLVDKVADNYIYVSKDSGSTSECDNNYDFYNDGVSYWRESNKDYEIYSVVPIDREAFIYDFETKNYTFDEEGYPELKDIVENEEKLLLIDDYNTYVRYEKEWDEWWQDGFEHSGNEAESWEKAYLDSGYTEPKCFKFCQDFEKYFLGLIHVPQMYEDKPIEGGKVPEEVYYLNFKDYLDWFKENEFKHSDDYTLQREWDSRGGDNFYAFLQTIVPIWTKRELPDLEEGETRTYFTFSYPYLNMSLLFQGNQEPEKMYSPYEYSISAVSEDEEVRVDATKPYVTPSSGVGSGLTPHFVNFIKWDEIAYGYEEYISEDIGETLYDLYNKLNDYEKKEEVGEDGYIHLYELIPEIVVSGDTSAETYVWAEIGVVIDEEAFEGYGSAPFDLKKEENVDGIIHYYHTNQDNYGQMETMLPTLHSDDAIYLADDIYGIFETFKNASGDSIGQLFECTYHIASSEVPESTIYYSGYTYEYGVLDHYDEFGNNMLEYVPQKIVTRETEFNTIAEETPKVTSNCYQVVDLQILQKGAEAIEVDSASTILENSYGMKLGELTYWTASTTNVYGWWECTKINFNVETMHCADGEIVNKNETSKYRNIMLLSNISNYVKSAEDGDTYYFMAIYDNGRTTSDLAEAATVLGSYDSLTELEDAHPIGNSGDAYIVGDNMCVWDNENNEWVFQFVWSAGTTDVSEYDNAYTSDIKRFKPPYEVDIPRNIRTFPSGNTEVQVYDVVTSMNYNEETYNLEIEYVLGATSGVDITETGIHCYEVIPYSLKKEKLPVDGVHLADVYCEKIEPVIQTVGDEDTRLTRDTQLATIVGMEVGGQWTEEGATSTYLLVRDGVGELMDEMRYDIDATFDRGNAAAWEKHFKLSECNTMEDLENYSNNIFNI